MTESRPAATKALIITALVGLGALLIAGSAVLIHRDGATRLTLGAKPPPLSSTSMEDWTKSVCQPGSFQDGLIDIGLPGATGTGHCIAAKDADVIVVGTYAGRRLFAGDIAQYRDAVYAAIRLTSGEIFAFVAPAPRDRSVLDPLSKYGFTIHGR